MTFSVLIPARYGASRFPGKPLVSIAGRPMLAHVHDIAQASGAKRVVIATDDARIQQACEGFGAEVVRTRADHASGTDRLAEAAGTLGLDDDEVVVNLQGDEPLLPPVLVAEAAATLDSAGGAVMGTLATPIVEHEHAVDPNIVKVVCDKHDMALYFSRAPIPWDRSAYGTPDGEAAPGTLRHLGIYAYRAGFLRLYPDLPVAPVEAVESLEQLRVLWHGYRIRVALASATPGPGVDTPADVACVEAALRTT